MTICCILRPTPKKGLASRSRNPIMMDLLKKKKSLTFVEDGLVQQTLFWTIVKGRGNTAGRFYSGEDRMSSTLSTTRASGNLWPRSMVSG